MEKTINGKMTKKEGRGLKSTPSVYWRKEV